MTQTTIAPRLDLHEQAPKLFAVMMRFNRELAAAGLDERLKQLVQTRASQINGCAFCIDLHVHEAVEAGEEVHRLLMLDAWREAPGFTDRERAALALTEAMTLLGPDGVPDDVFDRAAAELDQDELVPLIFAITAINAWNRLAITSRMVPGGA